MSALSLIRQTCFISTQIQHKQSYLFCPNVHHTSTCLVLPLLSAVKRFVAVMRKTNMCTLCKWSGNVLFVFQPVPAPSLRFTTVDTKAWSSNRDQGSVERARQQSRGICRMTDISVQFIEPNLTLCKINCVSPACHFVLPSETFSRKNCYPCMLGWQLSSNINIQ